MFGTGGYGTSGYGAGGAPAQNLTAFDRELGATQGRIVPVNFDPVEGDWVFCLGRDLARLEQDLNPGDFGEVVQTADFDTTDIVELTVRLRGAAAMPSGRSWKFSMRIDGSERVVRTLVDGEEIDHKIAANVSQLSGVHALAFRLELV